MARVDTFLVAPVTSLAVSSDNQSIAIESFEMTEGFEELFEGTYDLAENGWDTTDGMSYQVEEGELVTESQVPFYIQRRWPIRSFEFASNLRAIGKTKETVGEFGLLLRSDGLDDLTLSIHAETSTVRINGETVGTLPASVDLGEYHQLRIIISYGHALCYIDDVLLTDFQVTDSLFHASVFGRGVRLAIEMVRLTSI
jgi:hypothetical protein